MYSSGDERGRRVRILTGSAAFLMGLTFPLFTGSSAYSQMSSPAVVCYSVITVESEADLQTAAKRYHTTVAEILKENGTTSVRSGATVTIQEISTESKGASRSSVAGSTWIWPVNGVITSDFGWRKGDFHHGVDIAASSGTTIRAARPGRVVKTGWIGVYGLTVLIDHGNGIQTLYAHNSKVLVKVGDQVDKGEGIALSGNTGRTTGPHLHFEIRIDGKTVDPEHYLPKTQMVEEGPTLQQEDLQKIGLRQEIGS